MKTLSPSIYPAVFYRKSTRNYSDSPIPRDMLGKLQAFMSEAVPLFPSEKAVFEIQPHKGSVMKIAAYAESGANSRLNLAFMLQQMDLFLQTNGLGSLWNATVKTAEKQRQGLPYAICLIFGMAREYPVREEVGQFNRRQAWEISNKPHLPLVEAVRLAPSARNRQPWFLICQKGYVDFYCNKGGFIDNTLLKNLHWFDVGIAVCHAVLALQHNGFLPIARRRPSVSKEPGRTYAVSLIY